jgi:hypothetical protein
MGYYIQTDALTDKANYIVNNFEGELVSKPEKFVDVPKDKALIVVVSNGLFEAAGFVYNEREFLDFVTKNTNRHREYILMPYMKAVELTKLPEHYVRTHTRGY